MSKQRKTIAVISVHGVGDQQPLETARRIGDLLQELPAQMKSPSAQAEGCAAKAEFPRYYPFHEEKIRINVNPLVVQDSAPSEAASTPSGALGPFNSWVKSELKRKRARRAASTGSEKQPPEKPADVFVEFTKRQLCQYRGDKPEDTYETIRLQGTRAAIDGTSEVDVHIYELYWADLSRLKAGLLSIFTELYQLLFHLSSLGVHTVNAASLEHGDDWVWLSFRKLQSWSSLMLTIPIAIFNLLMLGLVLVLLGVIEAGSLEPSRQGGIIVATLGVGLLAVISVFMWRRLKKRPMSRASWLSAFLLCVVVSTAAVWYQQCYTVPLYQLHAAESLILFGMVAGLLFLVLKIYNRRRPGALKWGVVLSGLALLAGIPTFPCLRSQLAHFSLPSLVPQFWVREFETVYLATTLAWIGFFLCAIVNCFLGLAAVRRCPEATRDLAKRSRWTGCLMLSLPSLSYLVLTVTGWGVLAQLLKRWVPADPYCPLFAWSNATSMKQMPEAFLSGPVEIMLPVALFFIGVAALPAVWAMVPIVWSEVIPPPVPEAQKKEKSVPLGRWLGLTYRGALLLSGILIYLLMVLIMPVAAVMKSSAALNRMEFPQATSFFQYLGILSGAAFGWLFLARGSLKKLALGFRPTLDFLLDVDNWLREHPLDSNPKARICGRYVSLLRYLCNWKDDANPNGYEKIVIIAHSQGTVITADLFRFLNSQTGNTAGSTWLALDPQLLPLKSDSEKRKKIPVQFFTMGCPLRQLYGLRFPYLYGWARHQNLEEMGTWNGNDLGLLQPSPAPSPEELGINLWVNAFRSGDYVGRQLWRTDPCGYLWRVGPEDPSDPAAPAFRSSDGSRREEFCIGAGAHTHYWDETGFPMIALELDRLITL